MIEIYRLITSGKIMKDTVVGLSQLSRPIYQLLSKNSTVTGNDLDSK